MSLAVVLALILNPTLAVRPSLHEEFRPAGSRGSDREGAVSADSRSPPSLPDGRGRQPQGSLLQEGATSAGTLTPEDAAREATERKAYIRQHFFADLNAKEDDIGDWIVEHYDSEDPEPPALDAVSCLRVFTMLFGELTAEIVRFEKRVDDALEEYRGGAWSEAKFEEATNQETEAKAVNPAHALLVKMAAWILDGLDWSAVMPQEFGGGAWKSYVLKTLKNNVHGIFADLGH